MSTDHLSCAILCKAGPSQSALPRKRLILAIAQALMLVTMGSVQATTITVNSSLDDGTDCTLREAIANANNDDNGGGNGCASGSGPDVIAFDDSLSGSTITLDGFELTISESLSIDGDLDGDETADIEINGNNTSRVFYIDAADNVTLDSLSISGGSGFSGGGVFAKDASIELSNSTVSGNSAVTGGGGIDLYFATATLNNSTVSGNSSAFGGGVYAQESTITLNNSTVSGNSADIGSGIDVTNAAGTLNSSTVSGNNAEYGGGIYAGGVADIALSNTIVANSLGGDCFLSSGLSTNTHNHFEDASCDGVSGNNPRLGPLQDNGGPTLTLLPKPGSPAIDAGSNADAAGLQHDQRGFARIVNGTVDIGATEVSELKPVPTLTQWMQNLLVGLVALFALFGLQRRKKENEARPFHL